MVFACSNSDEKTVLTIGIFVTEREGTPFLKLFFYNARRNGVPDFFLASV
jgi:hypothetical protein